MPPLTPDTLKLVAGTDGLFCSDARCRCDGAGEMRISTLTGPVTLAGLRMSVEAHIAQWAAQDGAGA